jgi:transposase, IS5 family
MKQQTLAVAADQGAGFERFRRPTRRDEFLQTMQAIVPWEALCEVIEPHYPKSGRGRPPIGLMRMLRIHLIQHWFNLADVACEEAFTIVDATIIGAPSSTKNAEGARDPEMHQTKKGQQWYFGMKLRIGVDSRSGLAHSAVVTPANVHDKHPLPELLHGQERRVYGDSAYASQKELIHGKAPDA